MEDKNGATTSNKPKSFQPVKEYATQRQISVQAVYKAIKAGRLRMRKIGSYILVRDI
jgi:hypothetical protein